MTIRNNIRRHIAAAAAALTVSTFFVGAAVGPAISQLTAPVAAQQNAA